MTFDITAWLNESVTVHQEYDPPVQMPRHQRLCFLIYANGGLQVHGWGYLSSYGGGHPQGLEQNDALQLLEYSGFLSGLAAAGVNWADAFRPYFEAYKARWEQAA